MPQAQEADSDTEEDLDSMTKAELLAYADAHGIEGLSSRMLKADILEDLKNAISDMPVST